MALFLCYTMNMDEKNKTRKIAENIISQFTSPKKKEISAEELAFKNECKTMAELVQKQREYFFSGETRNPAFRAAALKKLYASIKAHEEDIAHALRDDLFKSPFESYATETGLVLKEIRYLYKHVRKWSRIKKACGELCIAPSSCRIMPEPFGVSLIMSPWNYPFMLTIEPLAAAIAAGNTAVVKPSRYSGATSALIQKIIQECFDEKYIAVVQGGHTQNTALLNQHFDFIFFTGSKNVGKIVMKSAAEFLTPVVLELGGKSPVIVDKSADIKMAARKIVWGKFLNSGQTCVAPDYLLVDESVEQDLLKEIQKQITAQFGTNPLMDDDYPKIINEKHFERILTLAPQAQRNPVSNKIAPTILPLGELFGEEATNAPAMQEEIFGPVLPVIHYKKIKDVIEYVRSHETPLALYLFARDKKIIRTVTNSLRYGGGCINDVVIHLTPSTVPFGGAGESGMGNYHGKFSFDTFTHYKTIVKKPASFDVQVRFAPHFDKIKFLRLVMK